MKGYQMFEVVFQNNTLTFTSKDPEFRNRLDVYNYVCANRLAKKYGKLIAIRETPVLF